MELLALLLLAFLLASAPALAQTNTAVYAVSGTSEVQCTVQVVGLRTQQLVPTCTNNANLKLKVIKRVKLSAKQRGNWRPTCTLACLRTKGCLAFTAPAGAKSQCQLFGNPAATLASCGLAQLRKVKKDAAVKIMLAEDCFDTSYTRRPTAKPTAAPIPACVLPETSQYYDEFRSLEMGPRVEVFNKIEPSSKLCEYVKLAPMGRMNTITNFTCTAEACIRWCEYSSNCLFAQYSAKEKTCTRADSMELADDSTKFRPYFTSQLVTYQSIFAGKTRYFAGFCNEFVRSYCNKDKQCGWNKGKKGYNDQIQGGSAGGFCGRIKCTAGF